MKQKYCGLEREIRGRKSNCTAGVKGRNIAGIVRMRNRKEAHMTKRKYNQKEVEQARRGRIISTVRTPVFLSEKAACTRGR